MKKANSETKRIHREFKIKKLIQEILCLTEQQEKHRQRVAEGCEDKHIKRFIKVVGQMILQYDKQLQSLIKERKNDEV